MTKEEFEYWQAEIAKSLISFYEEAYVTGTNSEEMGAYEMIVELARKGLEDGNTNR